MEHYTAYDVCARIQKEAGNFGFINKDFLGQKPRRKKCVRAFFTNMAHQPSSERDVLVKKRENFIRRRPLHFNRDALIKMEEARANILDNYHPRNYEI